MNDSQGERHHAASPLPTEASIDIRQVLRWAWRVALSGNYMLLSCWLLAIVPTVLYYQQQTPLYTATSTIMVEGTEASNAFAARTEFRFSVSENVLQTEVGVLTSRVLAERIIDKLNLDQDPEFNPSLRKPDRFSALLAGLNPLRLLSSMANPKTPPDKKAAGNPAVSQALQRAAIVDNFLSRLQATSQRRTYLIDVYFTSNDREKAALILNTVAQQYLLDRLEASFDDARRVTSWLEERLSALRQDVQASETAVEEFRARNGLRRSGDGRKTTLTDQQLSELNSRLIIARTDLAQKQARLSQIRSLLQSGNGLDSAYEVLQSPLIQRLREQESSLQREMSEALKTFGERHPKMVGYRADLEELQAKLRAEMQRISQGIANETEVSRAGVLTLERELSQLRNVADTAGTAEIQLRELERQSDTTRNLYEAFLQRFKREAETGSGGQRANARILSEAQIPAAASYPRTFRGISLISLISLLFGLLLIFVIDRMDNAIRSSDEAEDLTGLPTLAVIPLFRGDTKDMIQVLADKPRSSIADSFRSLRVSLDANDMGDGGRVIAMTSSVPREGKTFASVCLAAMYARGDQKVLLIDSDVHRPRTHIMLGQKNDKGLLHILNGEMAFEEAVVRSIAPNLDFLPAGHLQTIAEEVHKDAAAPLLDKLRQEYDRIIIDLPPVLAVSDARALSTLSDQVIYLVRWNSTARDAVRVGVRLLRDMNVNFAGVIISQINQTRHGQYAYGDYGTYYGRYSEYYTK